MEIVEHAYAELGRMGLCTSRSHFSVEWLGREQSYYRSIIARRGIISCEAHAHLASQLKSRAESLRNSSRPETALMSAALFALYEKCLEELLERVLLASLEVRVDYCPYKFG